MNPLRHRLQRLGASPLRPDGARPDGPRPDDVALAVAANGLVFALALMGLRGMDVPDLRDQPPPTAAVEFISLGQAPSPGDAGAKRAGHKKPSKARRAAKASEPSMTPDSAALPDRPSKTPPAVEPTADPAADEPLPDPAAPADASSELASEPSESEGEGEGEAADGADSGETGGEGAQDGAGGSEGSGDDIAAKALAFYRSRLSLWFAPHFNVRGSGLSADELARLRTRVRVDIDESRKILGYEIVSADHKSFRTAAEKAMDGLIGSTLPAPPASYPGELQREIVITFTCRQSACD